MLSEPFESPKVMSESKNEIWNTMGLYDITYRMVWRTLWCAEGNLRVWDHKADPHIHKSLSLNPITNYLNPVHIILPYFSKI
jgi:hypothetical protein